MGKIILFEEKNLQGRSTELTSDCTDISSILSRVQSVRVESGCFMVYERTNFLGMQVFLRRGEYPDIQRLLSMGITLDNIRSLRLIPTHRGPFRMRIYERENLSGQMNELVEDCESILDRFRMSDCQSVQVLEGNWLLFEQPQFRGRMILVRPGEHKSVSSMGLSSMRIMSMRRITDMC
ncbi:gamma-crystallin M1 [Synchiropus splendidus]|uniref:gamma-crystallin M1 n=1 Tax=Synchiropus splendidus TaxID=270530 RepID=UPI00237E0414|nr:gamma-crystallin M1 [Synchiropus splendidus]XP_053732692.1 gamma-crystallin M1 [Synchiropus splendidus]